MRQFLQLRLLQIPLGHLLGFHFIDVTSGNRFALLSVVVSKSCREKINTSAFISARFKENIPVASLSTAFLVELWAPEQANDNCSAEPDVVYEAVFSSFISEVEQARCLHFSSAYEKTMFRKQSWIFEIPDTYDFLVALWAQSFSDGLLARFKWVAHLRCRNACQSLLRPVDDPWLQVHH